MTADEPMRVCHKCGKLLPESAYYQRHGANPTPIKICKSCMKEYAKRRKEENGEIVKEIARKSREKHRNDRLQKERTYAKEKREERKITFNNSIKRDCEKCGEKRRYLIQFHHIDPKTKSFNIGEKYATKGIDELVKESQKCVCLCSNCHDEFHYFYGQHPNNPVGSLEEYLGRRLIATV